MELGQNIYRFSYSYQKHENLQIFWSNSVWKCSNQKWVSCITRPGPSDKSWKVGHQKKNILIFYCIWKINETKGSMQRSELWDEDCLCLDEFLENTSNNIGESFQLIATKLWWCLSTANRQHMDYSMSSHRSKSFVGFWPVLSELWPRKRYNISIRMIEQIPL